MYISLFRILGHISVCSQSSCMFLFECIKLLSVRKLPTFVMIDVPNEIIFKSKHTKKGDTDKARSDEGFGNVNRSCEKENIPVAKKKIAL